LWVARQCIDRIEAIHQKNFIHRDIKPENFLIGHGKKQNIVYLIDFGLSKRYRCPKTNQHNPNKLKGGVVGTPRYISLNAHKAFEQSRRDDLESIGLMLVYFFNKGKLPWMRAEKIEDGKRSREQQLNIKESTDMDSLCENMPTCMYSYMTYCRSLKFEQKPDYKFLKGLFDTAYNDYNFPHDFVFEWQIYKENMLERKLKEERDLREAEELKKISKKAPNKRETYMAAQKALFEKQEEEKKQQKEEKKKKKAAK
jgi:casein kinase 1